MASAHYEFIEPIDDAEHLDKVEATLSWLIRCETNLREHLINLTLFKFEDWAAVPCASSIFTDRVSQEQLTERLITLECQMLYAISLCFKLTNYWAYKIPATYTEINNFFARPTFSLGALFAGDIESTQPYWAIISIESDYFIFVGPTKIVEHLLGHSIEESFSQFYRYIVELNDSSPYSLGEKLHFTCIYNQLQNYLLAEDGTEFWLGHSSDVTN